MKVESQEEIERYRNEWYGALEKMSKVVDSIVVNMRVGFFISEIAGFEPSDISSSENENEVYSIGNIHGLDIKVDPKLPWDDTDIRTDGIKVPTIL